MVVHTLLIGWMPAGFVAWTKVGWAICSWTVLGSACGAGMGLACARRCGVQYASSALADTVFVAVATAACAGATVISRDSAAVRSTARFCARCQTRLWAAGESWGAGPVAQ